MTTGPAFAEPAAATATVAPHDDDAEQQVIAAILLGAAGSLEAGHKTYDRAVAAGLRPDDFYRHSFGALFAILGDLRRRGEPLGALALSRELERLTDERLDGLASVVGAVVDRQWLRARLHMLVAVAPPLGTVGHRAELVRNDADDRRQPRCG